MKITAFILFAFCLQVSAATLGQTVTLNEHKASLEKVINDIKQQTGYSFFYNEEWLKQSQPVDINVKNTPLERALKLCFNAQPYDYAIVNKTIVLKLKIKQNTEMPAVDPVILTGRVTDSLGTPLIGATVAIKGGKGTITNDKGEFSIAANIGDQIIISFIGYKPYQFTVNGALPSHDIKLMSTTTGLEEVVVNTGYQTLPQERATGSFAKIDNKELNRRISPNILERIEGLAPGVLFNANVNPANEKNGVDIGIRGYSTLQANGQPLIVVDNFPYNGPISNINPNDVENITILKDAAASAVWGINAGNGVIVITTKKGSRSQKLKVEGTANTTITDKPNLFYDPNYIRSTDFIDIEKWLFGQGYYDATLSNGTSHPPYTPVVQILADQRSGKISTASANAQIDALRNNDVRNDLLKYFYQKGIHQQYAFNFSGGSDKNDYYFSGGYDNDQTYLKGNGNYRLTFDNLFHFYLSKKLTITAGFNYIQANGQTNSPVGDIKMSSTQGIYPYAKLVGDNGQGLPIVHYYSYQWVTDPSIQAGLMNWRYVPLNELNNADNETKSSKNVLNFGIRYDLPKGFNADIKYQYDKIISGNNNYYNDSTYYARNLINQYTNRSTATPQYPIPVGGIYFTNENTEVVNSLRAQLNYSSTWSNDHKITGAIGGDISQDLTTFLTNDTMYGFDKSTGVSQYVNFATSYLTYPSGSYSLIPNQGGYSQTNIRSIDYFSLASYSYKDKYLVTGSARIDKGNLFGVNTNQKAVPLWSAGVGWELSKESFYHLEWLPYVKIKTTYGYTGNLIRSYAAFPTATYINSSYFYHIPYEQITNPGNPDLRWEKDRMINLSLDFATKNNRINGTIQYYQKDGMDLFGYSALAPATGYPSTIRNAANIAGHGIELNVNATAIQTRQFNWKANLIFSNSIDKVTNYGQIVPVSTLLQSNAGVINPVIGNPIFSMYSYKSGPLTHATGDPQGYLNGQLSTDYTNIIKNTTSADSLKYWGPSRPTVYGSLLNTFTYQSFSLSFNIYYKFNYYFRRNSINYNALFSGGVMNKDFYKRWMKPGDELTTSVPSMPSSVNSTNAIRDNFYTYSEAVIDKGDNIRLQDVNISWNINTRRLFGKSAPSTQVSCYVNNIGILWRANHDGLDPDTYTSYPVPRTYSIMIKTNF